MSKARLVITAVVHEQRPVSEVAAAYGMHRSWIYRLLARYRTEGQAAYQPRSRRPKTVPNATDPAVIELALKLRGELEAQGLDAGAHTICWHLREHHGITVSPATIWRHLRKHGKIVPQPKKRPRSSYIRFQADLPNQLWQTDFTHVRLANSRDVEVLSFLDDHSRYALSVTAHQAVTGGAVVATFDAAAASPWHPRQCLVRQRDGVYHPVRRRPRRPQQVRTPPPATRRGAETLPPQPPHHLRKSGAVPADPLEVARPATATGQPHRTASPTGPVRRRLQHRPTPPLAGRPNPSRGLPSPTQSNPHRHQPSPLPHPHDTVDTTGVVTLRYAGRLHHIGLGRTYARTRILMLMLIQDRHIRITHATTGALIRELTLDPSKDYQPLKIKQTEPVGSACR